ncbi:GTPase ObgE [Candidatus Bipolaricaulota bacterium]|jgi:GTP-binding protein|nr:GTPase ObgE [Candidatus Bipolaricaulota bacterium]
MFIDEATVRVRGGRGGNGVIHFVSGPKNPHGGPDGGNAGGGGSVVLEASPSLSTLYRFRHRPLFEAENGVNGSRNNKQGATGPDLIVLVPLGTIIRDTTSGELLADLSRAGEQALVAEGGEGGRGNSSFTTSRRRAPRICERGLGGDARTLKLELKLIADIGIIGFPNVGKSSLISSISGKRAKVADYPFTTLVPNLGVVDVDGKNQFVAVDVPGLVQGAHEGRGLGDRFLRHVERTAAFIHMIDLAPMEERDPVQDYDAINHELESFNPHLAKRPQIVVGNKIDAVSDEDLERVQEQFRERGIDLLPISVATSHGVRTLVQRAFYLLQGVRTKDEPETIPVRRKIYRFEGETGFSVDREDGVLVVYGKTVENLVKKLVLDSYDAQEYLGLRLDKMGVLKELRRQGLTDTETVRIGEIELELEG